MDSEWNLIESKIVPILLLRSFFSSMLSHNEKVALLFLGNKNSLSIRKIKYPVQTCSFVHFHVNENLSKQMMCNFELCNLIYVNQKSYRYYSPQVGSYTL